MRDDFCHCLALDRIRDGERIDLVADEAEREGIAKRLGLLSLDRLEANAALEQSCVASGDPVTEHVDEPFDLIFLPEPQAGEAEDEVELAPEDCDVVFHDGAAIDLGSAVTDTLALAINPYPRSPGAEAALQQAGVLTEEQASPFAVLARLKKGGDGP